MKLLNILFILLSTTYGLINISNVKINIHNTLLSSNKIIFKNDDNNKVSYKNKSKNLLKLIRYKNILPTFLLSLTGGLLINPTKILSCGFFISVVNTILIMSSSMVINDIFDINIDKINNYDRPLVNGDITIKEAVIFLCILLGLTEYLSIYFLSANLQNIIHYAMIFITIYTPILKRIPFIKNISCAFLVSFSIFFSGLSTGNIKLNKNYYLFLITINLIFFGSLYNELLLDMRDYEGDKENKIYTIPVLFGNKKSWNIVNIILNTSIILNTCALTYLLNFYYGVILLFIFIPIKNELYTIKKCNYYKNIIISSINNTTKPLYFLLLYMIILSFI